MNAPPNEHMKKTFRKWLFSHPKREQIWPKKKLWLDRCVKKVFWVKESVQLVIPVRSTLHSDSHPPIGGPHRQLDFI